MILILMFLFSLCAASTSSGSRQERTALIFIVAAAVLITCFVSGYFWFKSEKKPKEMAQADAAMLKKERKALNKEQKQALFNQKLEEIEAAQQSEFLTKAILEALKMCALDDVFGFNNSVSSFLVFDKKYEKNCAPKEEIINLLKILYDKTSFIDENGEEKEIVNCPKKHLLFLVDNDGKCCFQEIKSLPLPDMISKEGKNFCGAFIAHFFGYEFSFSFFFNCEKQ